MKPNNNNNNKMDGRGHFNTARIERLPKKTKVMQY